MRRPAVVLEELAQVKTLKVRAALPPRGRGDPPEQQRVLQRHVAAHHLDLVLVTAPARLQQLAPPRRVGGLVSDHRQGRDGVLDRSRRHEHDGDAHALARVREKVEAVVTVVDDQVVEWQQPGDVRRAPLQRAEHGRELGLLLVEQQLAAARPWRAQDGRARVVEAKELRHLVHCRHALPPAVAPRRRELEREHVVALRARAHLRGQQVLVAAGVERAHLSMYRP